MSVLCPSPGLLRPGLTLFLCMYSTCNSLQQGLLPYGIIPHLEPRLFCTSVKSHLRWRCPACSGWLWLPSGWPRCLRPALHRRSAFPASLQLRLQELSSDSLITGMEMQTSGSGFTALPRLAPPSPSCLLRSPTVTQPTPSVLALLWLPLPPLSFRPAALSMKSCLSFCSFLTGTVREFSWILSVIQCLLHKMGIACVSFGLHTTSSWAWKDQ